MAAKPRILVCAPSNAAADELLERCMDSGFADGQVWQQLLLPAPQSNSFNADIMRRWGATCPNFSGSFTRPVSHAGHASVHDGRGEVTSWRVGERAARILWQLHEACFTSREHSCAQWKR